MTHRVAPWIAVAALLGLVVLSVFLAASFSRMDLTEGSAFDERIDSRTRSALHSRLDEPLRSIDYVFAYAPIGLLTLGILIYAVSRYRKAQALGHRRRGMVPATIAVVAIMIVLALMARQQMMGTEGEELIESQQASQTADVSEPAPPNVAAQAEPDTPSDEARATSVLLQVAFGLLAIGAFAGLVVAAMRLRASRPKAPPLRESIIRDSVDDALRKLRLGRDAAGVVEECYRDMVRAFAESAGVDPRPLTPREFARSLELEGLGGEPLEELTALFELVRYGRRADEPLAPRALRCMTQLRDSLQAAVAAADS